MCIFDKSVSNLITLQALDFETIFHNHENNNIHCLIHGDGPMAGALVWSLLDDCRLLPQYVWRRGEGPARPPTARRSGQLWYCDGETQKRFPGPTDQPFRLEIEDSTGRYCRTE